MVRLRIASILGCLLCLPAEGGLPQPRGNRRAGDLGSRPRAIAIRMLSPRAHTAACPYSCALRGTPGFVAHELHEMAGQLRLGGTRRAHDEPRQVSHHRWIERRWSGWLGDDEQRRIRVEKRGIGSLHFGTRH